MQLLALACAAALAAAGSAPEPAPPGISTDNTTIATNYRQHALFVDYGLTDGIVLDATLYRYRPYDAAFSGTDDPQDWLNRLRVNFQVGF